MPSPATRALRWLVRALLWFVDEFAIGTRLLWRLALSLGLMFTVGFYIVTDILMPTAAVARFTAFILFVERGPKVILSFFIGYLTTGLLVVKVLRRPLHAFAYPDAGARKDE